MELTNKKNSAKNLINIKNIVKIYSFNFGPNFKSEEAVHDFWEIIFCDKGKISCISDNSKTILSDGDILFNKPNERHTLYTNDEKANVIIIAFITNDKSIEHFENYTSQLDDNLKQYLYNIVDEGKRLFNLSLSSLGTTKISLSKKIPQDSRQIIKNLLEIFLLLLLRKDKTQKNVKSVFLSQTKKTNIDLTNQIIAFLKANINKKVSIDNVCDNLHYSRSYIFRQFKNSTGTTIIEYFIKIKIEAAKKLLLTTNKSIKEITVDLGYEEPNYFFKQFYKLENMTPLEYRKKFVTIN